VVGIEDVLGRGLTWGPAPHSGSGCYEQGPIGSGKLGTESLNRTPVFLAVRSEVLKVVIESAMDHAIRLGRSAAQTFQTFQRPSMHLGTRCQKSPCARVGARHPEHLMTRFDQFRNNRGTDETRSSRKKHTHAEYSFRLRCLEIRNRY
jgi:hypothetical protein